MLVVELVSKALARSKSFGLIFILNFALAIASLSYLQFFKTSMETSLESKAKVLLGADMVVASRFPIAKTQIDELKSRLPAIKDFDEGISTVSMVASDTRARLMEVVQLSKGFPYYGGLVFHDSSTYPQGTPMPQEDEAWVYQEVLDLLGLKRGDRLKIGNAHFVVAKIIQEDTLKTISFNGFLPKVYITPQGFKRSELLQFGSTAQYKLNFRFKQNFSNDALETIENQIKKGIDPNLRVLSPNDGRDRLLNVMLWITYFLSLVSLVSFFL
ncbi:MAG: hypothetical protein JXQ76_12725, partial [Campylobacterales bacterium]|nr:hypothetical protein [Campylobacterales bacterium]